MKHFILALALLTSAVESTCAQQVSAPPGNVESGKTLYLQLGCYQCHGLAGQGALMTGPRVSRTEFAFDSFLVQLRNPANQMPPYEAAVLSNREAADLYAYLSQMASPRDPNSIPLLKTAR